MSTPILTGWRTHEITDGGGRFQVLVRRAARVAARTPALGAAPTAQNRSIAGGGFKVAPAIERTGAVDFRVDQGIPTSAANPRGCGARGARAVPG